MSEGSTLESIEEREAALAAREEDVKKREADQVAADEARATTRGEGAEASKVSKLDSDDPLAGTVDDPNVEDPYAHLRAKKEEGTP